MGEKFQFDPIQQSVVTPLTGAARIQSWVTVHSSTTAFPYLMIAKPFPKFMLLNGDIAYTVYFEKRDFKTKKHQTFAPPRRFCLVRAQPRQSDRGGLW